MDTPRLLPQPSLLLEGFRHYMALPLWQEGAGGCVMSHYYSNIVSSPIADHTHFLNDSHFLTHTE